MDETERGRLVRWLVSKSDDDLMPTEAQLEDYVLGAAGLEEAALAECASADSPQVGPRLVQVRREFEAPATADEQRAISRIEARASGSAPPRTDDTLPPTRAWRAVLTFSESTRATLAGLARPQPALVFGPRDVRPSFSEQSAVGDFQVLLRESLPWDAVLRQEPGQPEPQPILVASVRTFRDPGDGGLLLSIGAGGGQVTRPLSLTHSVTGAEGRSGEEWSGQADFGPVGELLPESSAQTPHWELTIRRE